MLQTFYYCKRFCQCRQRYLFDNGRAAEQLDSEWFWAFALRFANCCGTLEVRLQRKNLGCRAVVPTNTGSLKVTLGSLYGLLFTRHLHIRLPVVISCSTFQHIPDFNARLCVGSLVHPTTLLSYKINMGAEVQKRIVDSDAGEGEAFMCFIVDQNVSHRASHPYFSRFFWSPLALSTSWPNPQCSKLLKGECIRLL